MPNWWEQARDYYRGMDDARAPLAGDVSPQDPYREEEFLPQPSVQLTPDDMAESILKALRQLPTLLPWIFPPASVLIFEQPQLNTGINVNPAATTTLATYAVSSGHRGQIAFFGCAGSDLSNLKWTIFVNGAPRPPIVALTLQYGTIAAPTRIPGPGILLGPGDGIQVQVENTGLAVISAVQARIGGYLWPSDF